MELWLYLCGITLLIILKNNLFEIGCLLIILRMSRTGAKGVALPGGPAGAFAIAFGAVGAVYLMMKYVRRRVKNLRYLLVISLNA